MKDEDYKAKETRIVIQILDETTVDELILNLVYNGYKVNLSQDKKRITGEIRFYYFKEKDE